MERRKFFRNFVAGGSLLLTAPMLFESCSKDELVGVSDNNSGNNSGTGSETTVDLTNAAYSDLKTVGGFVYSGNIIIIRTGDTQYTALSKICTHQGCTVSYSNTEQKIVCPCHGSKYSTNGSVLNGPATASLKKYTVTVSGNTLKIV